MRRFFAPIVAILALFILSACGANATQPGLLPETDQPIFAFFYTDN